MYELLGISLVLAALLTINALASLVSEGLWYVVRPWRLRRSARAQAQLAFVLRVTPCIFAFAFVVAIFVPAYVIHEPRSTQEVVSPKLAALAALSLIGIALAAGRGIAAWRATRRLVREWRRHSQPVRLPRAALPAHRIHHVFPVVAIIGTFRPRLFIAEQVLAALDADELDAVIRHETAHVHARDNFKRVIVRACRDALSIIPCGRALDRAWADAVERAADEDAAQAGGTGAALNLASALIKIARLAPISATPLMPPAGSFLVGASSIAERVHLLTQSSGRRHARPAPGFSYKSRFVLLSLSALLSAYTLIIGYEALASVHSAIEHFVAALQ